MANLFEELDELVAEEAIVERLNKMDDRAILQRTYSEVKRKGGEQSELKKGLILYRMLEIEPDYDCMQTFTSDPLSEKMHQVCFNSGFPKVHEWYLDNMQCSTFEKLIRVSYIDGIAQDFLKRHFDELAMMSSKLIISQLAGLWFNDKPGLFDGKRDQCMLFAKNLLLHHDGGLVYSGDIGYLIILWMKAGFTDVVDVLLQRCFYVYQFPLVVKSWVTGSDVDFTQDDSDHIYKRWFRNIIFRCFNDVDDFELLGSCLEVVKDYVEYSTFRMFETNLSAWQKYLTVSKNQWKTKICLIELFRRGKLVPVTLCHQGDSVLWWFEKEAKKTKQDICVLLMLIECGQEGLPGAIAEFISSYLI